MTETSTAVATAQLIFRWFHIFFGIVWIGHLYFFNFVNVPFQGVLEKELKPKVNPALLLRSLWWFRWAAMGTLVFGLLLFFMYYWPMGGFLFDEDGLSLRGMWILFGGLLGTVMWFNVWFVIWPAQKKIIGGMMGGAPAPPELPKRALLFSRINTFLSAPMLVGMAFAAHPLESSAVPAIVALVVIVVVLGAIHGAIKTSYKVGTGL